MYTPSARRARLCGVAFPAGAREADRDERDRATPSRRTSARIDQERSASRPRAGFAPAATPVVVTTPRFTWGAACDAMGVSAASGLIMQPSRCNA